MSGTNKTEKIKDKKIRSVDPVILILILMVVAAVATYILPAGTFERVPIEGSDYEAVVPGSFTFTENNPVAPFDVVLAVTRGLQKGASVIFGLIIIGGAFKIVENTGALKAGLGSMVKKLSGKELLLAPLCVIIFGLVSCFAGCWEEFLPFIPLICAVCIAMGFDSITAILIVFGGAAAGYGGAVTNVYIVGVAQGIAELPIFSGMSFRRVVFIILELCTIIYAYLYARKVRKNPEKSSMRQIDLTRNDMLDLSSLGTFTLRQKLVLTVFFGGFVAIAFCVIKFGFYIDEIAAIFLIIGILAGIIGKMPVKEMMDSFFDGCRDFFQLTPAKNLYIHI